MPRYSPIDAGTAFDCVDSDILAVEWTVRGFSADFILPGDGSRALRVSFDRQVIARLLDEMALSTEAEATANEGLVPHHFAYRVEGASFAESQSEAWKSSFGAASAPVRHYRFVTGWGCVDVLSSATASFELVER